MIFSWLRRRRRRKLLAVPLPDRWKQIIVENVWQASHLTESQMIQLHDFVRIFVSEKNWEGCNGFQITDEAKVTVAAQAALLAFGEHGRYFDHVLSILIYPSEFVAKDRETNSAGVVVESDTAMLGQAVWRGPVLLSWPQVLTGGRRRPWGSNLVLHEFAHQLDMMNGQHVDGLPPISSRDELQRWQAVMKPEFEQLRRDCRHRHRTVLDCYGTTNEAEFLAVLVEAFFERSAAMKERHSAAYELLSDYFQVDPASWPGCEIS